MSFNQLAPSVPTVINASNVFVFGNTASGNALSVQQLGAGNVASFRTTTGATALFINPSGNVGVGTTNPATALDVFTGTMNAATVVATTHYGAIAGSNTVSASTVTGGTSVSAPTVVGSTALYGVLAGSNTVSASTVSGTTITASSSFSGPGTNLTGSATSLSVGGSAGSLSTTYAAGRILYGAGSGVPTTVSTLFYDSANGRVGIGTASPSYTLDCWTGTVQANQVRAPSGNYLTLVNGAGGSQIVLQGTTTAITGGAVIMTGGNVGIGTASPINQFHVSGGRSRFDAASEPYAIAVSYSQGTGGSYWIGASNSATPDLVFSQGGGSERMRITNGGNVGIGTANPGSLLEISATGAVHASGTLSFYRSDAATFWKFQGPDTGNTLYLKPTNSAYGVYITATSTAWASASDARLKNIIEPISDAVAKVNRLNPVIYSWKADETNQPHPGLIAQDVLEVQPEVVATDGNGMYGVQYTELVPLAFAAIKELSAENTQLKTQMASLESRLAALEARA